MGIENIDFLKADAFEERPTTRREVSQHIVEDEQFKFVYGWDHPLQSFFLQKHDRSLPEDDRVIVWLGATAETRMYEVEDLVRMAKKHGCYIPHHQRVKLYGEKDDGN